MQIGSANFSEMTEGDPNLNSIVLLNREEFNARYQMR